MSDRSLGVIVLAAGEGRRMKSSLPKVLHPVCGKAMAAHILDAARSLSPTRIAVVVGHRADEVRSALAASDVEFVEQTELLGTADAVGRCEDVLANCTSIMVLNGDTPLVTPWLLAELLTRSETARRLAFAASTVADAGKLGRVSRDERGEVAGIVEAADYRGPDGPAEINAGQYVFQGPWLWANVPNAPRSTKGEYYLTALVQMAHAQGRPGVTVASDRDSMLGCDDRVKLAEAEAIMRRRILERHMLDGVTVADPATTYIDADARLGRDVTVLPNCYLYGATNVASGSVIGPGTTLRNAVIGEGCRVQSSVIEDSKVGDHVTVGPFSHIRDGATIGDDCEIHNYAEIKNSVLGAGVKMHHFSYLGDADVGEETNIGAGSITCNYDGEQKHRTTIGRRVFVGSDTLLVAPVTLGDGAFTASGAVVTKDVPPGERVAGVPARPLPRKSADA
jgi:bifunctional UDP-N-acetylglucosamine pyrophosphorylase / glucosamine-1-phosphate N-acetyltransferase